MPGIIISKIKDYFIYESTLMLHDDRVPVIIPFLEDKKWGILMPCLDGWIHLSVSFMIQIIICAILSTIIYHFILLPRCSPSSKSKNNNNVTPYLVGYGIILPISLLYPYYVIHYLNMRNRTMMLNTCIVSTYVTGRCLEAMHAIDPPAPPFYRRDCSYGKKDESYYYCSLWNYLVYASLPVELLCHPPEESTNGNAFTQQHQQQNSKPKRSLPFSNIFLKSTWDDVITNGMIGIVSFISLTILVSILIPLDWKLIPISQEEEEEEELWSYRMKYFRVGHIVNNFVLAMCFYLCINFGNKLLETSINLFTGLKPRSFMDNPMFASKSPRDFWSCRWNLLYQNLIKRSVYKPLVRQEHISKTTATILTFFISGMFHEQVATIFTYTHTTDSNSLSFSHGGNLLFFLWNGMLVFLESTRFGKRIGHLLSPITGKMPRVIQSLLVVCMSLPLSHYVTSDIVKSRYFDHISMLLPIIVRVQ